MAGMKDPAGHDNLRNKAVRIGKTNDDVRVGTARARQARAQCGHRFTPSVGFCDNGSVGHAADDRQAADMQAMAHDLHGTPWKQALARRANPAHQWPPSARCR